jgi:diguanylate cyclase (GGDEF)-like protein
MGRILVVEDSETLLKYESLRLTETFPDINIDLAKNLKEAKNHLVTNPSDDYYVALLDLNLPDAPNGEIVDAVMRYDIPIIVFTGTYDESLRRRVLSKRILDYIVKSNATNFDFALQLIKFIVNNKDSAILIVDDSTTQREHLKIILERQVMRVYEAENGKEALEVIEEHPEIKMVLTDKEMPVMNGIELTSKLRMNYSADELAIIGLSSAEGLISIEFLKAGANDFLKKPYVEEELLSRIVINMQMIDYVLQEKEFATKDFLTGIYNRKHLFEQGTKVYNKAKQKKIPLVAAMMDIDHFKKVNDTYGHQAGDVAIKMVATMLKDSLASNKSIIVSRYGGEEFCIIIPNACIDKVEKKLNHIRKKIEETTITSEEHVFNITISSGITENQSTSLQSMIDLADQALYQAKEGGRNQVRVIH